MTATVDATLTLPRSQATPGGEIVRTDGRQGGLRQIARAQNTLAHQHRGPLVVAGSTTGTPILTGTGKIARWKVKLQPNLGLQNEDATAYVDIYVAGAGSVTVEARWTQAGGGSATVSNTFSAGPRARLNIDADNVTDDGVSMDVELEITASTVTTVEIYGFDLNYVRTLVALEVLATQQQGTAASIPLDDALTDSERPATPGLVYAMHGNARDLYKRTGMAMACAYPEDLSSAPQVFSVPVPEGADELTVWVYVEGTPTAGNGLTIQIGTSVGIEVTIVSGTWYSHTATVTGLRSVRVTYDVTGAGALVHADCSAYFEDRDVEVYAVHLLVDEFGNNVVDEFGNYIAGFG